tara:strand:+ start:3686 stop:5719 length:2034 start_codon:yes stop_codon:yes gene_type:complete
MKECILGISAFGHDTSACLVEIKTAKTIFASAQERYSNIKFDDTVPFYTISECIKFADKYDYNIIKATIACDYNLFLGDHFISEIKKNINSEDISTKYFDFLKSQLKVSKYYNFFSYKNNQVDEYIEDNLYNLSKEKLTNLKKLNSWYFNWAIKHRNIENIIQQFIGKIPLIRVSHHISHAASSYFSSGFSDSNIIVMDGQGEQDTITIFNAVDRKINLISKTVWPNSVGMFYLAGTSHLGYKLGDEYKVMGMSAHGKNEYVKYLEPAFKINQKGQLIISENEYIGFSEIKDTSHKNICFKSSFAKILPKNNTRNFKQEHFNFAKTIQTITENIGVALAEWAYSKTNSNKICLSGGVALNGLMNNKILNSQHFNDAFVYPASGDDGTSVGSALYVLSQDKDIDFNNKKIFTCFHGYKDSFSKFINSNDKILKYIKYEKKKETEKFIAEKVHDNKVMAIFNSGAEFGPRSLGARSIIANATNPNMREILNKKIKLREPFRPFAPICLSHEVNNFFEIKNESNFMLFICQTKKEKIKLIPSVVHEDGTARVQSVDNNNPFIKKILEEYNSISGIPILINTSFNIGGEAIVNTIQDAIESFKQMDIDYLIIDDYVLTKNEMFLPKKLSVKKFIENRQKRFLDNNKYPIYKISYFNSHFYVNFYQFLKKKIYEKLFMKNYL